MQGEDLASLKRGAVLKKGVWIAYPYESDIQRVCFSASDAGCREPPTPALNGRTALQAAMDLGYASVVDFLIESGARRD